MAEPKTNACTGKCCVVFNYSVSLDVLRERDDDESKFLVDMLIELTPEEAQARAEKHNVSPPQGYTLDQWANQGSQLYTCRHWDEETMLCGVYEDRPRMCRDYPYAAKCQHDCACSYTAPPEVINTYAVFNVRHAAHEAGLS